MGTRGRKEEAVVDVVVAVVVVVVVVVVVESEGGNTGGEEEEEEGEGFATGSASVAGVDGDCPRKEGEGRRRRDGFILIVN